MASVRRSSIAPAGAFGEPGTVILDGARTAAIDAELAGAYRELRQDLAAR